MDNSSLDLVTLPTECFLCPRACGVNRAHGDRGFCGIGAELVVARAALHAWEEPPISGSSGSGTIFFSGCSLKCVYCQNAAIALGEAGSSVTPGEVADMCLSLQDAGALNINMVTASHVAPLVRASIKRARALGMNLPVVWNTSGYETVEAIHANTGFVDVYLSDFKYASPTLAEAYSHAADYPDVAMRALEAMVETAGEPAFDMFCDQKRMVSGVVVRHLMLPGALDDSKHVVKLLWERFGESLALSLMNQYTPVLAKQAQMGHAQSIQTLNHHPELATSVDDEDYERLLDYADSLGVPDYFWQQGGAAQESFIPAFDLTGVK